MWQPTTASTEEVPSSQRLAYWQDWNADSLLSLNCSTAAPQRFFAESRQWTGSDLRVTEIKGTSHVVHRLDTRVRPRGATSTFVSIMVEGSGFFYHADGLLRVRAGEAIVYRTDAPYLFGFESQMRQLILEVPTELEESLTHEHRNSPTLLQAPRVLDLNDWAQSLLARQAQPTVSEFTSHLESLFQAPDVLASIRSQCLKLISENFSNASLSVADLARQLHLSERHLRRAFAAVEDTPSKAIERERLALVESRVKTEDVSLTEIAISSGFTSGAQLGRAIQRSYGITASELKKRLS